MGRNKRVQIRVVVGVNDGEYVVGDVNSLISGLSPQWPHIVKFHFSGSYSHANTCPHG